MSDRIAVMRSGRFVETGSPEELYHRPRSSFTAHFVGGANVVPGTVEGASPTPGLTVLTTTAGVFWSADASPPGPVAIFIRPERIRVVTAGDEPDRNVFACRVRSQRFAGDSAELELTLVGPQTDVVLRCKTTQPVAALKPGESVRIVIHPADVRILRSE
jgi:ABC-type Fe3+/spermidine/putrescine transport system ATPase subunit